MSDLSSAMVKALCWYRDREGAGDFTLGTFNALHRRGLIRFKDRGMRGRWELTAIGREVLAELETAPP